MNENNFWARKSLVWIFAISDIKMRYRNSVLGIMWNFLEPLLMLTILYFVFSTIFKNTIEYFPLYLLLGLIMWTFFTRGTAAGLNSIQVRGSFLKQINIPITIVPTSAVVSSLIMTMFEMVIFVFFLGVFQFLPPITVIILPVLFILEFFVILGIALALSTLSIKFRDTKFIWAIILQAGFFLHPIFYQLDILPPFLQKILLYIPTVQILIMARDVTLYGKLPSIESFLITIITSSIILGIGYFVFKKHSRKIIEEV